MTPALVGTADVPFSTARAIALLANGRTACVVDSCDHRVRCVDPDGSVVGVFGREGEGPGEFEFPTDLGRGESGSVGVFDMGLGRFTIYEPAGALLHTVRLPGYGDLDATGAFRRIRVGDRNDQRAGYLRGGCRPEAVFRRFTRSMSPRERFSEERNSRLSPCRLTAGGSCMDARTPVAAGFFLPVRAMSSSLPRMVRRRRLRRPRIRGNCRRSSMLPSSLPRGSISLRWACRFRRNASMSTGRRQNGINWRRASTVSTRTAGGGSLPRAITVSFSYLDVFCDGRYVGTVQVRDRLWGFDILESRLAVVVDRLAGSDDEPSAIPARGVDWYDIGGLSWQAPSACS